MPRDLTRKIRREDIPSAEANFFAHNRATLILVSGGAAGAEYLLESSGIVMGRGPGAALVFDDDAMSREHAVLEVTGEGFRVRDLGSTNGLSVNGAPTQTAELKHGDRIEIGEHAFQYLLEPREDRPPTYVLPED